jgi:ribosomal protein S21
MLKGKVANQTVRSPNNIEEALQAFKKERQRL